MAKSVLFWPFAFFMAYGQIWLTASDQKPYCNTALLSFYRYRIVSGSTISKITNGITSGISAVAITLIAVAIPMVSIALIVPYILFFTSKVPLNYDQKYLCYLIKGGPVVSSWCGMDAILSGESAEISWE